jgi:uncharacterized protein (DUF934 family)
MAKRIIVDKAIVDDTWIAVADDTDVPEYGEILVSFDRWNANRDELKARRDPVGVQLNGEQDIRSLADDLDALALVAFEFPVFADGRCYTHARILRDQLGFKGQIRAVGDILRDQIFYMNRVGFDAFEVSDTQAIEEVIEGLNDFSVTYQASSDVRTPLYRRRATA